MTPTSFAKIMRSTLRMLRHLTRAKTCLFILRDDEGSFVIRGSDGPAKALETLTATWTPETGPAARCLKQNRIVIETIKNSEKILLVPVRGEKRALGILVLGPFQKTEKIKANEQELLSAGALCAVLSANWRLYDWMSGFLPQINHQLRTPLTAVQGSIGMVLGGMFGPVGGEVKEMLEMAQKGCERTVKTIEEYLDQRSDKRVKS